MNKLIKQHDRPKTSSTGGEPPPKGYGLRGFIRYDALLPKSAELETVDDVVRLLRGDYAGGFVDPEVEELFPMGDAPGGPLVHHYIVTGTLGTERADAALWREPPHEAFANLRAFGPGLVDPNVAENFIKVMEEHARRYRRVLVDAKVAQNFIKTHGVICGRVVSEPESEPRFYENSAELSKAQGLLRRAWAGDSTAIKEIEKQAAGALEVRPSAQAGGVELVAKKLWSFICILFLRDHGAGKTGVCANPGCPAPYFLKSRRSQKYCASGPCTAYAHRLHALDHYHKKGKKRRAKQRAKSNRRTKR